MIKCIFVFFIFQFIFILKIGFFGSVKDFVEFCVRDFNSIINNKVIVIFDEMLNIIDQCQSVYFRIDFILIKRSEWMCFSENYRYDFIQYFCILDIIRVVAVFVVIFLIDIELDVVIQMISQLRFVISIQLVVYIIIIYMLSFISIVFIIFIIQIFGQLILSCYVLYMSFLFVVIMCYDFMKNYFIFCLFIICIIFIQILMLLKVKCQFFKEKNNVFLNTINVVFIKFFWFFGICVWFCFFILNSGIFFRYVCCMFFFIRIE